jgi:hypothetical protein
MRTLVALLVGLLALPASAEIYRYTDEKGNTVFTNQPPANVDSQQIRLPPANTVQSAPAEAYQNPGQQNQEQQAPYRRLELTDLPDAEALRANNGTFTVNVAIEPELAVNHRLQLLLDGKTHGTASSSPQLQVINLDRGDHSLAVAVVSGNRVVQQSDARALTVQRVNVNTSPALRPPPPPKPKPAPPAAPAPKPTFTPKAP